VYNVKLDDGRAVKKAKLGGIHAPPLVGTEVRLSALGCASLRVVGSVLARQGEREREREPLLARRVIC
jgi:hypothetical protein